MINANIKKAIVDAIGCENKAERKWLDAGAAVRGEYASREALEAVRPQFLAEVIYPALGEDAIRVINAEIPRKGSKDWNAASADQQAAWSAINEGKKITRASRRGSLGGWLLVHVLQSRFKMADDRPDVERCALVLLASLDQGGQLLV